MLLNAAQPGAGSSREPGAGGSRGPGAAGAPLGMEALKCPCSISVEAHLTPHTSYLTPHPGAAGSREQPGSGSSRDQPGATHHFRF